MILLIPILALLIGALLAPHFIAPIGGHVNLFGTSVNPAVYAAIACLAGLDSVCGGIRSGMEGKFTNSVFLTGFFSNVLIAFGMAYLGDNIGANLFLGVVLVLGQRIFLNLSLIRRLLLTQWQDFTQRRKLLEAQRVAQTEIAG